MVEVAVGGGCERWRLWAVEVVYGGGAGNRKQASFFLIGVSSNRGASANKRIFYFNTGDILGSTQ